MFCRLALTCALFLLLAHAVMAQTVFRAFVGEDGQARVVYANGAAKTIPREQKQVGCGDISVAEDKRAVGWSVLIENCCTSYPIPTAIVLYRNRKKTIISTGQMIWQWHFIARGDRVAVLSGPVHGWAAEAILYDVRSTKVLASWNGTGTAPEWAKGLGKRI